MGRGPRSRDIDMGWLQPHATRGAGLVLHISLSLSPSLWHPFLRVLFFFLLFLIFNFIFANASHNPASIIHMRLQIGIMG